MTLQITTTELTTIIDKAGKWHSERAETVINMLQSLMTPEVIKSLQETRKDFEARNPKPTWKDLL